MIIKTIDVNAKEWFDKVNGNSYFSAVITLNHGLKDSKDIKLPFQYGYGDQYQFEALKEIKKQFKGMVEGGSLWSYCNNNHIILKAVMDENCLQREVKSFGGVSNE